MNILIGLLPALLWGCTPLWTHFLGGKPITQLVGTTYGALVVGVVLYLIDRPTIDLATFGWCFLAGCCWSAGQLATYTSFQRLGVSTTIPISAGVQLVVVNIAGVLFFGSWASTLAKLIGFGAVILVILGVFFASRTGEKNPNPSDKKEFIKNLSIMIAGAALGYGSCSVLPRIPNAQGFATFPCQSVGMLAAALLFAILFYRQEHPFFQKETFKNMITGFNSGIGTFTYLTSFLINGVSTGFTLSQMTTVVSTFGGLVILHEKKTPKQLHYTLTGVALVVIGGIMTGFIK